MRKALVGSLVLHLAVVIVAYLGVPMTQKDFVPGSNSVAVEMVAVAETTNLPPPGPASQPVPATPAARPAARVDSKPPVQPSVQPPGQPSPKPASQARSAAPPKPKTVKSETVEKEAAKTRSPQKEVKPAAQASAPAPVMKPQPVAKSEPQPSKPALSQPASAPESRTAAANLKPAPPPKPVPREQKADSPKPAAAAKSRPATAAVESKPAAATDFQSVLKAVGSLSPSETQKPSTAAKPATAAAAKTDAKPAEPEASDKAMEALLGEALGTGAATASAAASTGTYDPSQPMSVSEIDEVRRQIEKCWNVPAGARDSSDHVVTIRVEMSPDATPRSAIVVNGTSTHGNAFRRAAAESALRAVLNPRCHPFRLPMEKYERWKTMTLVFNPKDMLGT